MLVGSFMILCEGDTSEIVASAFRRLTSCFVQYYDYFRHAAADLTVFDCWEALDLAVKMGWLDFQNAEVDIDPCIDIQVAFSSPLQRQQAGDLEPC
jgi:hypothetical protein